jgi:hypothetical protein
VFKKLWLLPPLAFARIGGSESPCDNFSWGQNDLRHKGSGKTFIVAQRSLHVDRDGHVTEREPSSELTFKDADDRFRPVAPFFELHGEWTDGQTICRGPVTWAVLKQHGLTAADVTWSIAVANLKPYQHTRAPGDRVIAEMTVRGDVTTRRPLLGVSPAAPAHPHPLVIDAAPLPLGELQITKLDADASVCRMRVTPPKGLVYAPRDFKTRVSEIEKRAGAANKTTRWRGFALNDDRLILNPEAVWPRWRPERKGFVTHRACDRDFRTMPILTYAHDDTDGDSFTSLGLVDDTCDGLVRCTIGSLTATARVVVTPPHFAPDRRPIVSLADGLTDRVKRGEIDLSYVEDVEQTTLEVRDLFERAFETLELSNLDALNDRIRQLNEEIAKDRAVHPSVIADKHFPTSEVLAKRHLPLTEQARQRHRRMLALEVLEDRLREDPALIDRVIRAPLSGDPYFDQRMPALTRGSDGLPMHLTRRQYDLLVTWARALQRRATEGR